jgi:demethoxyubiquinone hydroxylase (CLK1/Coq7/Cat5 family)
MACQSRSCGGRQGHVAGHLGLLANESPELRQRLEAFRAEQTEVARNMTLPPTA